MAHNDIFMFVDESGCDHNSKILALACIITTNPEKLRREIKNLQNAILCDPILRDVSSVQNSLSTHGFHYCEDHSQEVKPRVIDLIMTLPFEAYIIYQKKDINFDLSQGYGWYDCLFGRLMYERLRANSEAIIQLCFEQHDNRIERRKEEISSTIKRLTTEIRERDGETKFPVVPNVVSAGKEEPCLAIADYIAAIFKDYEEMRQPGSWQARNFQRVRPKIRVIHDFTTDEFFTRTRPFT
jgi:hypothetical protein